VLLPAYEAVGVDTFEAYDHGVGRERHDVGIGVEKHQAVVHQRFAGSDLASRRVFCGREFSATFLVSDTWWKHTLRLVFRTEHVGKQLVAHDLAL
jgi:hypothetical protein